MTSGAHLGYRDQGAYGASKGAVASFTYTWAIELREAGENDLVTARNLIDGYLSAARELFFVGQLIAGHVVRSRLQGAKSDLAGRGRRWTWRWRSRWNAIWNGCG